jgi:hypothetical protein
LYRRIGSIQLITLNQKRPHKALNLLCPRTSIALSRTGRRTNLSQGFAGQKLTLYDRDTAEDALKWGDQSAVLHGPTTVRGELKKGQSDELGGNIGGLVFCDVPSDGTATTDVHHRMS